MVDTVNNLYYTDKCPVCEAPARIESEEVDIGVGVQVHVTGAECMDCGHIAVCQGCGSWKECLPWCENLSKTLQQVMEDLDKL